MNEPKSIVDSGVLVVLFQILSTPPPPPFLHNLTHLIAHLIFYPIFSKPQIFIGPAGYYTSTIDCTDVVESIVNKATPAQNDKLHKITNTIVIQQQQVTNIITGLPGLTEQLIKMYYPQTNPQYQPTSPSESQQENASFHHSNNNVSMEAWHPSHNASIEAQLPHSATTTGDQ